MKKILILAAALSSANAFATPITIDFSGTKSSGTTYQEDGFTFTAQNSNGFYISNGILDAHDHWYTAQNVVLTSDSGNFDFDAFDLRQQGNFENLTLSNNLGASLTFNYSNYSNWNTITLDDSWNNLSWVRFDSTYDITLDNVLVNNQPTTVSEPATIALLGLGLAGVATTRRKKQK